MVERSILKFEITVCLTLCFVSEVWWDGKAGRLSSLLIPFTSLVLVPSYLSPCPWYSCVPLGLSFHVTSKRPIGPSALGRGSGAGMGRVRVRNAYTTKCQGWTLQELSLPQAGSITTHSATRPRRALYIP